MEFKVGGDDNDEQEEIEAENRRNANHRRLHIDNGNQGGTFNSGKALWDCVLSLGLESMFFCMSKHMTI